MTYTEIVYVPPQEWNSAYFDSYGIGTLGTAYWTDDSFTELRIPGSNGSIAYLFNQGFGYYGGNVTSVEIRDSNGRLIVADTGLSVYWDGTEVGFESAMNQYIQMDLNVILTDSDDFYDIDPAQDGLLSSGGETLSIDGQGGFDTIYSSNWNTSDFTISRKTNGNYEVTIKATGEQTELINIEYIDLADTDLLTIDRAYVMYGLDSYFVSKEAGQASSAVLNSTRSPNGVTVSTSYSLDMTDLDLNRLYAGAWQYGLYDDSNFDFNGQIYEDAYVVDWQMGSYYYGSVFGGVGLTVDADQVIAGGVATGYLETYWDGSAYIPYLAIEGISIDAIDIWSAASTSSLTDDHSLLELMLFGDDVINGSGYSDTLIGLAGNDKFYASQGNDLIYGGVGLDTYYAENLQRSDLTVTAITGGYEIVSSAYGTDNVYQIENVILSDGAFSLSDLINAPLNNNRSSNGVTISTSYAFDMTDLDLNRLYAGAWQSGLLDNFNLSFNGQIYEDAYVVDWQMGSYYYGSVFGGVGLTVDADQVIAGGVATGYLETYWDGSAYIPYLAIEGISIDAIDIWSAASTSSLTDDHSLLELMLFGDDVINGSGYSDTLIGLAGNDSISSVSGADWILGGSGNDEIVLASDSTYGSDLIAINADLYSLSGGMRHVVDLTGKGRLEKVIDGGTDSDTILLSGSADALFLHDTLSSFYYDAELVLSSDFKGNQGTARITNIETIRAGAGDDLIDMTSPDYTNGVGITAYGESGNDILWGTELADVLYGGDDDDVLFGGAGNDALYGGAGQDRFEFAYGSGSDRIDDFNINEDTLVFYARDGLGESTQDATSFTLSNGNEIVWANVIIALDGLNNIDQSTLDVVFEVI